MLFDITPISCAIHRGGITPLFYVRFSCEKNKPSTLKTALTTFRVAELVFIDWDYIFLCCFTTLDEITFLWLSNSHSCELCPMIFFTATELSVRFSSIKMVHKSEKSRFILCTHFMAKGQMHSENISKKMSVLPTLKISSRNKQNPKEKATTIAEWQLNFVFTKKWNNQRNINHYAYYNGTVAACCYFVDLFLFNLFQIWEHTFCLLSRVSQHYFGADNSKIAPKRVKQFRNL